MKKHIEETIEMYEAYDPPLTKQKDHDDFWDKTLQQAQQRPLNDRWEKIEYPIKEIEAYQVTYEGADETPIHANYIVPRDHHSNLPCLIIFHGYGGHKKSISVYMKWLIQGYAVLAVDSRGHGESPDHAKYPTDTMGTWVTRGILDKQTYYYRHVYVDAVRAIDVVCTRPEIDQKRIAIMGGSMGGGITLAVASLDDRPKLAIADMPNMCDLGLAIQQKTEGSLTYIEDFLHRYPQHWDQVYQTLTYFDNLNHVEHIKCRIRLSVGLKDPVCPPMPIFGVYRQIKAPKSIEIFPFTGHDTDIMEHHDNTLAYVNAYL